MGAPNRRSIYLASLEAHVDRLHAQLLTLGLYPVPFEKLEPYRGLNSKTAKVSLDSINSVIRGIDRGHKSMVAGLQHDISLTRMKLLELERSVSTFRCPKKKKIEREANFFDMTRSMHADLMYRPLPQTHVSPVELPRSSLSRSPSLPLHFIVSI